MVLGNEADKLKEIEGKTRIAWISVRWASQAKLGTMPIVQVAFYTRSSTLVDRTTSLWDWKKETTFFSCLFSRTPRTMTNIYLVGHVALRRLLHCFLSKQKKSKHPIWSISLSLRDKSTRLFLVLQAGQMLQYASR